jgi:hypothetical protein
MTRRSIGGNARNGMNRSHERSNTPTVFGYFFPSSELGERVQLGPGRVGVGGRCRSA